MQSYTLLFNKHEFSAECEENCHVEECCISVVMQYESDEASVVLVCL